MSEPRLAYMNTLNCEILQADISALQEKLHTDIEYYEMDMSKELLADLRALEELCRSVGDRILKERVEYDKDNRYGAGDLAGSRE